MTEGLVVLGTLLVCAATAAALAKGLLHVVRPDEMLVFSGRMRINDRGEPVDYRIVRQGRTWQIPTLERVSRMDLRPFSFEFEVKNAYSKAVIPLIVRGAGSARVDPREPMCSHAVERFLDRDPSEMRQCAQEIVESHLRPLVSQHTPESIAFDLAAFTAKLVSDVELDFARLGFAIDSLVVRSVTDEVAYLDSLVHKQMRGDGKEDEE